jgi:hypothetical protein
MLIIIYMQIKFYLSQWLCQIIKNLYIKITMKIWQIFSLKKCNKNKENKNSSHKDKCIMIISIINNISKNNL